MAEYARIRLSGWSDPHFKRSLSPLQKLLLLYYRSSPHGNLIGLYSCPPEYAAAETGIPADDVRAWSTGALSPWITYDPATEEVFVHDAAADQVGELKANDNRVATVLRVLESIHSKPLLRAFQGAYPDWIETIEGAPKGLPRGLQGVFSTDLSTSFPQRSPFKGASEAPLKPSLALSVTSLPSTETERQVGIVPAGSPAHARADGSQAPQPTEDRDAEDKRFAGDDPDGQRTPAVGDVPMAGRTASGAGFTASSRQREGPPSSDCADLAAGEPSGEGSQRSPTVRDPLSNSDEGATLARLAREFAARQAEVEREKQPQPTAIVVAAPLPPADEPMPEHFTAQQVVDLWAARQPFPPDKASRQQQAAAAKSLAQRPAELVVRALYGIALVWPHAPPPKGKGESWNLSDVLRQWSKALQASENHPALVDARTAKAITAGMNGR